MRRIHWLSILILILVLAIAKKGWAAIKAGLDARAENIRTSLDEAARQRLRDRGYRLASDAA